MLIQNPGSTKAVRKANVKENKVSSEKKSSGTKTASAAKVPSTPPKKPSPRKKTKQFIEDDTEYASKVIDEALSGNFFPADTYKQARGGFIVDLNPVSIDSLKKTLSKVPSNHSVLVVPQLTILPGCDERNGKWGWVQTGMGPHYDGIWSMAVCRQEKRILPCVQTLAEQGKLWCAVLAAKTVMNAAFSKDFKIRDNPPYWLVSLHKVVYTVPTQKRYSELLREISPNSIELKRNDIHRRGDLFYPKQTALETAKKRKISDDDIDFWGDLENFEDVHPNNRHLVQSTYNPSQPERLIKDVKYVRNKRISYIHVGRPPTHENYEKESFAWRDSGIQFFDERYADVKRGGGLQPHGGLVPMEIFRKSLHKGETLKAWAEPRRKK